MAPTYHVVAGFRPINVRFDVRAPHTQPSPAMAVWAMSADLPDAD